ncbi:MAG: efflux RND transporter periplasmic adaptor subunit [Hyphomicrobiaceae bacterium]|nr:efflux RND transporter periplasmic adaptor subunit [Hyphomicrobiaceae bacterium]
MNNKIAILKILENPKKGCEKPLSDQRGSPVSRQTAIAAGYKIYAASSGLSSSAKRPLALVISLLFVLPTFPSFAKGQEAIAGRIVAWRSGKVSTQVPGLIKELRVRVGDKVKKGDIIARFDTSQLALDEALEKGALAAARAKVNIAIAQRNLQQNILIRQKRLKRTKVFLISRYDAAVLNVAIAKAGVSAARAEVATKQASLKRKQLDIALSTVKAPYSGIVKKLLTQKGAFVIPEDPHLIELVDTNSLEIEVDIPVRYIHFMKHGEKVSFRLDGQSYAARLRAVLPTVNLRSQTRAVRFTPLDISSLKLHAVGQNTDVIIPKSHK